MCGLVRNALVSQQVFEFVGDFFHGGLQVRRDPAAELDARDIRPGLKPLPQPIEFRRRVGFRIYDSIWDCGGLMLLSPKFYETIERIGATGWTSYPVKIYGRDDALIEGYRCLVVTGRDPTIEYIRPGTPELAAEWSGLDYVPYRRFASEGELDPNPDRPPAFDFIVPETTVMFCISRRVKEACEEAGLRGLRYNTIGWVQQLCVPGEKVKSD